MYDADTRRDSCALLAVERDPGSYRGFWTYDPERVDEIVLALRGAVERAEQ
ncbi:hypothetical protein [Halosegnis marinus]|uniref:hypothetical protein n=1 Tax=Halosegnis marinus TaxID=3034023 RepID=UPI00361C95E9